jgi:CDGSH-type Zn-finger protein
MSLPTVITVKSDGSLRIEGTFKLMDEDGIEYNLQQRTVISLCRCGLSANKPFCDGAHKENFSHHAIAFDLPPKKV